MASEWDGVPENPREYGPHWLRMLDGGPIVGDKPFIREWQPGAPGTWVLATGGYLSPHEAARCWRYDGPAITPAQRAADLAAARREHPRLLNEIIELRRVLRSNQRGIKAIIQQTSKCRGDQSYRDAVRFIDRTARGMLCRDSDAG